MPRHHQHRVRDVGIVMPVYKQRSKYVKEAIESVLHQSFRHFWFVIVLDGTPRHTRRLIRKLTKHDSRVHIVKHSHNKGICAALNRGFHRLYRHHNVRYLTWVSSDNVYHPDFVRQLRRKLRRSPSKVGLSYSAFNHVDANGNILWAGEFHEQFRKFQQQPREKLLDDCFLGPSFMYKRRYAERAGDYYLSPVEDYDYYLRLTDHCEIAYVPVELMDYRVESDYSISKTLSSEKDGHRRWRYGYNLAKLTARERRGIPVETTIIIPVVSVTKDAIAELEALYDQSYSNYRAVIIDGTLDGSAQRKLARIRDPRVSFESMPGATVEQMIQHAMNASVTPIRLVYRLDERHENYQLQGEVAAYFG